MWIGSTFLLVPQNFLSKPRIIYPVPYTWHLKVGKSERVTCLEALIFPPQSGFSSSFPMSLNDTVIYQVAWCRNLAPSLFLPFLLARTSWPPAKSDDLPAFYHHLCCCNLHTNQCHLLRLESSELPVFILLLLLNPQNSKSDLLKI